MIIDATSIKFLERKEMAYLVILAECTETPL